MGEAISLGPVRGRARIDVMDVLRGIAILGILFMNIPFMATNPAIWMDDVRRLSWSPLDATTWAAIDIFWSGTQRGLFEFLFGAGVMVLTARAMRPEDPVAVADLYYRRNLLLVAFGLIDIFVIAWVGDILLAYGLSALFLFPFRKASPKILLAMGLGFAAFVAVTGTIGYTGRIEMIDKVEVLEKKQADGVKLGEKDKKTIAEWQEKRDAHDLSKPPSKDTQDKIKAENEAHAGNPWMFLRNNWTVWNKIFGDGHGTLFTIVEAVCAMFIGMALWKWGVIQGQRPVRFYAITAVAAYAVGCGLRAWNVAELYTFTLDPKSGWITHEFARLAVTLGHVAFFNLVMKTAAGRNVLAPFKAVGRMAFSIYVLTSVVTLWLIFAPWGLDLWGKFGWAQLALAAAVIDVFMLVFANVWLRYYLSGPLEWVWRSLAYGKRQPFVRHPAEPAAPGTLAPA
ncbi:DUF418 domain-containing protein [Novosphingobium sp. AP12]|uniref:DUF418 domain-containing protein n=1 Tax=Novosphingobium sp. AP12 TaxID=1144305 RepID=UPI00027205F5|nr:DUF418 domain-containing protein [Novosphingobium sp. AP12]EJL22649.1 putative membrane protein [Novosphingobium sp. AP12]